MSQVPISVHILEREYQVMCTEDEREDLIASAHKLNARMREIRATGRIVGGERIAVMTALNLIHELMQRDTAQTVAEQSLVARLSGLSASIDRVLEAATPSENQGAYSGT